jgi:hypothetical protein
MRFLWYIFNMSKNSPHEMSPPARGDSYHTPEPRLLGPDEKVEVDLERPFLDGREMLQDVGVTGSLVADVNAASAHFLIIDVRDTASDMDFYIIDDSFSPHENKGFKGVLANTPVVIGREHHADRFSYPITVSRKHFEVAYDGQGLYVRNLQPSNSTIVLAHLQAEIAPEAAVPSYPVNDQRTVGVVDRIQQHPSYGETDGEAPYGYYMNYPILGRDSKSVDGGVYLGGSAREAIVVDGRSIAMRRAYEGIVLELQQSIDEQKTVLTEVVLSNLIRVVQELMPYDGQRTREISRIHQGDSLVGLSTYLKERAGVCRHQALLAAFFIEHLIADGYLRGSVSVERNTVEDLGGTHAWAIYKPSSDESDAVLVVDPAQSFVGTKTQARREGRWEYYLSTDQYY